MRDENHKLVLRTGLVRDLRSSLACLFISMTVLTVGCEEEKPITPVRIDSGIITFEYEADDDDKSNVFPLVGRWYPVHEVKRLSDRKLTAEELCERPPERITIELDRARVQCATGTEYIATISEVRTSSIPNHYTVSFRAGKDAVLRSLVFAPVMGTGAQIRETPCSPGKSVAYQRFPEYDVLRRKIIEGRPCSLVTGDKPKP